MPDPGETYRRRVIRAEFEYRGVPDRDDWDSLTALEREVAAEMVEEQGQAAFTGAVMARQAQMDSAYAMMLVGVSEAFPDAPLTPDRIASVEQSVRKAMAGFSVSAEDVIIGATSDGRQAAVRAHQNGLNEASAGTGVTISDQFILNKIEEIRNRAEKRQTVDADPTALIRRSTTAAVESTASWIRDQEGRPGRAAARELLNSMGEHDRIAAALEDQGQRGENVRRAIQRAGRAAEDLESESKNLYVNAKRIMVHEQNVAFHEADVLAAQESPAVKALRWRVSADHPFLDSSPDQCDVAANADLHGLGDGLYFPGSAPSLLHPYCECAVIPETVPPERWGEFDYEDDEVPNRTPDAMSEEDMAAIMRRHLTAEGGSVTQAKVEDATERFNRKVQVAHDKFVDF